MYLNQTIMDLNMRYVICKLWLEPKIFMYSCGTNKMDSYKYDILYLFLLKNSYQFFQQVNIYFHPKCVISNNILYMLKFYKAFL